MDAINSAVNVINRSIDTGIAYVTDNAFALAALLAIAYFVRTNGTFFLQDALTFVLLTIACMHASHGTFHPFFSLSLSIPVMKNGGLNSTGYTLSGGAQNATSSATTSRSVSGGSSGSREDHMRQVRLKQQELATQRAAEAAKVRKEKEAEDRERKNNVAKPKKETGGDKLGGGSGNNNTSSSSGDACAYTPMQPWASNSSGYRYVRVCLCLQNILFIKKEMSFQIS
jgi:hypothetical protein